MTRSLRWMTGSVLVAVVSWLGVTVGVTPASAASCVGATIAQGQGLTLEVSDVLVTTGGCVRYANLTNVTVSVRISGSSFSERIPAKTPASASAAFTATKSATATATDGIRTGHGSITVEAPPPPAPTPSYASPVESLAPTPHSHTPTPPPTATPSPTPSSASPTPTPTQSSSTVVIPVLPSLPGGGASAPPEASHPVVAPQLAGSGTRQAATVLEPSGGSRRGLPAAVAAVLVIGLGTAFGRAALAAAPAVDRRRRQVRAPL